MDVEANKAIVRRYVEMWNTGKAAIADEVLAPTYRDHTHPEVAGPEDVKRTLQQIRAADPDFAIIITAMIGEADKVALRSTVRRTHQGRLAIAPVIWFVRIADGKMAELWTGVEQLG